MKNILIKCVRFYQKFISPLKGFSSCRFYPSCSQYAVEAIDKFGALKGTKMAIWRIIRCNPFSEGGYDPVPLKEDKYIHHYKRRK